jgi:tripartite-type tricarboxylate transporter receptor subunit TctC
MITRRDWIASVACTGCGITTTDAALAQAYPTQPIRLIVPFPPAGATDIVSRMIAGAITAVMGWTFVIDNRAGASGNIGLDAAAKARPDGYTLAMGQTANLAINPALYPKMPFDPLKDIEGHRAHSPGRFATARVDGQRR